jgi:predicted dehydrogenase
MTKFIVIGLGSMGKRRIRCLKSLGYSEIFGYDISESRRIESKKKYNISILDNLDNLNVKDFDAFIISTPPNLHIEYLKMAIENKIPAFVEASVLKDGLEQLDAISKKNEVVIAPSCTMSFHPLIKDIKSIVESKKYGNVTNFTYHSGQYLPDWHPWEDIQDFYVSNRNTGGCREIVPFELTWLCDIIGLPDEIKGYFGKTYDLKVGIEDTYCFSLKFPNIIGSVTIDVVSRTATRQLVLNLERAQISWNWNDSKIRVYESENRRWVEYHQSKSKSAEGYNENIIEEMYIDEIKTFIDASNGLITFPNNLKKDISILNLLYQIENSDGGF